MCGVGVFYQDCVAWRSCGRLVLACSGRGVVEWEVRGVVWSGVGVCVCASVGGKYLCVVCVHVLCMCVGTRVCGYRQVRCVGLLGTIVASGNTEICADKESKSVTASKKNRHVSKILSLVPSIFFPFLKNDFCEEKSLSMSKNKIAQSFLTYPQRVVDFFTPFPPSRLPKTPSPSPGQMFFLSSKNK